MGDIVALVEQAERGDPILDRRAIFALNRRGSGLCANRLRNFRSRRVRIAAAVTRGQQQDQPGRKQAPHDQASGLQAS